MANTTTPAVDNSGRYTLTIDTAKTLASTDCGVVQNCIKTVTITLPATVVGYYFIIRNAGAAAGGTSGSGANGTVTITVQPNASDQFIGLGFTATDNKQAINTLGTVGDELQVVGDGVNGYMVASSKGTWTRQA